VSREFFDRALALKNLHATRARLEALMARGEKLSDVMDIERELARVRGDMEKLEGAERWQRDAVTWATVEITLSARGAAGLGARPKLLFGPRATTLAIVGGETLAGGGATFLFDRSFSMDVDVFEQRTVLATIGGAAYSDLLGGGRRRFANPYLGWRLGYGYLDQRSRFVISAELGLELIKTKYVALDASARALGLVGSVTDGGVQGQVGLLVAF